MRGLSRLLSAAAKSAAYDALSRYVVRRLRKISPDDVIKAIESGDVDVASRLSSRDRRMLSLAASRFYEYLDVLTVSNVMRWLTEYAPFIAGIIYGHPKGLEWLRGVIENIKSSAVSELARQVELVDVGRAER